MSVDKIAWKLIDTYFKDNVNNLVAHHLESYNDFFSSGINNIFKENNPFRFIEKEDKINPEKKERNECLLYLGGRDGSKIYYGKPIIYDDDRTHYMYPNDARLRNMTYGVAIEYDVDVDIIYYEEGVKKEKSITLERIYLGRFPIMLQSNLCILKSLNPEVRFNMGECRNDYGGYFIIGGKEKVIVSQEEFAGNMLNVKKYKDDEEFSYSAEIKSISEDASKPIRTTAVRMVAPGAKYKNGQLVVEIPNVRKEIPLFIVMRALGVVSDKSIIETCLLDLDKYSSYIDYFIPSIHDANKIYNQQTAIEFIASFTKRETTTGVLEILTNYFLPHIGELNYLDKAYFLGYMALKLLKVYAGDEKPTNRDNYRFKRIELTGTLIYDLFREYYLIQKRDIERNIDLEYYWRKGKYKNDDEENDAKKNAEKYKNNFASLIEDNYKKFFSERIVEEGIRKGFKGNWGSQTYTKRLGIVQDLNRLSWFTHISHLRKTNLPMDPTAKVVGPRLLDGSQWGFLDFVDTPDGANIGFHKHISITTAITSGFSSFPIIKWLRANTPLKILQECSPAYLANNAKVIVNGNWIGVVDSPLEIVKTMKLFRRNGVFPPHMSISFDYKNEEIYIYTDSGRLTRPIYYVENGKASFEREGVKKLFEDNDITWQKIVSGFKQKSDENFSIKNNKIYDLLELYPDLKDYKTTQDIDAVLMKNQSVVDYIDVAEEESALFAINHEELVNNKFYTHLEIHPSLILGVMGNSVIYPEHNPIARDVFSCSQSRQAVSVYHSNFQMRIDKMGVILNYGQTPLIKSRYLEYINKEEQPYGVNAIVAIMSYTGYNVEDAILINEGAIKRGMFRTTYYTMYEAREESSKISKSSVSSVFSDVINSKRNIVGKKRDHDYSKLDSYGMIKENTEIDDKTIVIGQITISSNDPDVGTDVSVTPKKGQLGFVDKSFITEGEEGTKMAKVRVREERLPALGDKMACALPTQQVLTDKGWIEIKDIDIKVHKVATLDVNGNMCYEFPVNKFEYDHNGKMYSVKNKQVEVVCTLNHKLYIKRREKPMNTKDYELVEAEKIVGKMVRFQKSMKNIYKDVEWMVLGDKKYKMDDWLQLLGMFISDGHVNNRAVILSAHKQRKIDFNTDILTKLGIDFYHDNYHGYFAINIGKNNEIYNELKQYSLGALNKYLPEYIWSLSQRQCIILLEALIEGDGHTYADGFSRYGTISPRLANDICRLAVHCGWSGITKIAAEPNEGKHVITGTMGYKKGKSHIIESKNTYYKVSIIRKQNQPYINKKVNNSNKEELIDYEGKVYCIEMPSSHLYYMRENNFAPSMLIGNSRAGQKGTLGLIIPEENMPFTAEGIRPDLIINPHAIPSRMTIGQLVEALYGKLCASYGGFGDCTAFEIKGPNTKIYGDILTKAGFHSSGNEIMYSGYTGEQLQADIYVGPTYYMRLKHMVKDKINYRARGPMTMLTRQTVQGRANDGGLRVGEMERDAILSHGMSYFLNESFLVRGDEYYMAICNKTGCIAIYNSSKNLFMSPFADGPIRFNTLPDGKTMNVDKITRFGRSFSILRIPYSFKLLIQELQAMNIQMRIITDENIDQLMNLSFSNNIFNLVDYDRNVSQDSKFAETYKNFKRKGEKEAIENNDIKNYNEKMNVTFAYMKKIIEDKTNDINKTENKSRDALIAEMMQAPREEVNFIGVDSNESIDYPDVSSPYDPNSEPFIPASPTETNPESPLVNNPESPQYQPGSLNPGEQPIVAPTQPDFGSQELNDFFATLPEKSKNQILALGLRDGILILKRVKLQKDKKDLEKEKEKFAIETSGVKQLGDTQILNVEEKKEETGEEKKEDNKEENNSSGDGMKKINI